MTAAQIGKLRHRQHLGRNGFSLIETMIAVVVLGVGSLAMVGLVASSVATNNRSRVDSSGTLLAQMVMENIASVSADSTSTVTITDCNPSSGSASHTVDTAGSGAMSASGSGAPLIASGSFLGDIDFTATAVTGYSMQYYACQASTGDRQTIYDVRWNIKQPSTNTKFVTVAARQMNTSTSLNNLALFAVPVSLHVMVGK